MRLHRITAGLAAGLALLAAVVGVPAVLVAIGAVPTSVPSMEQVRHALLVSDQNMAVVFAVLGAIAWFCWAAFTLSTIREIAAAIRTRGRGSARPLPSLEWVGRPAAHLVAAVVLLFVSAPALISATSPTAAASPVVSTATLADSGVVTHAEVATPATGVRVGAASTTAGRRHRQTATYTVQRRDSLWSIAATQLGDPLRWPELAQLNPAVVGPAPDFLIRAGSTLTLGRPADQGSGATFEQVVVVKSGDTLSAISADHGAGDWRETWSVNQDRPEPDGAVLTDPNHIEPGWSVGVPATFAPRAPSADTPPPTTPSTLLPAPAVRSAPALTSRAMSPHAMSPHAQSPQALSPPDRTVVPGGVKADTLEKQPTRGAGPQATRAVPSPVGAIGHISNTVQTPEGAGSQVGAFVAGGGLLAGGVLGALLVQRRRQFRNRRTGRTIASTPPELIEVEKAVISHGRPGLAKAGFLDTALRSLSAVTAADPDGRLPDVVAVRHGGDQLNLRLAAPHLGPVPAPWMVDESGLWWSISTEQELPVSDANAGSYLAPLPTLAAIGTDAHGYAWLLDLERAGAIALTGDPTRCLNLARFLAAELSVNTWSDHLGATMVGFGEELVGLNSARLRHSLGLNGTAAVLTVEAVEAVDACTRAGMDVRTGRVRDVCGDTLMPHVLLVAPHLVGDSVRLADLLQIVATHPGRAAMAIILAGDSVLSGQTSWSMHLSEAGHLIVPELGLDLIANQLTCDEGLGISQMLSQAAVAAEEPMPAAGGAEPWQAYCDAAGSLLPEHTLPRCVEGELPLPIGEAAATSLLPLPDQSYQDAAATTADDLATLAPRVPATIRPAVEAADPTLDADVAAWLDPSSDLPRLTLLGPVQLRAHGELEKNRVGFYTEIVAYLATRENGATLAQFETAFNLAPTRARSDIRIARNWLGVNPRTGRKHLPDALKSTSGQARGIGVYELEDVLVDADLFRRLRVRGQARGADGIADLTTALSLVSGPPFDQLRSGGYEWLTDGARIDHHLVCGIADVAHLVTTHALAVGDIKRARAAAEIAQLAAPYEEIPRLDLVAVREAEGHIEEAADYLRDNVCNRSDDHGAPEDLSERTQAILRRREWLSRAG
jgi:nucleoid-associated protein YgaU